MTILNDVDDERPPLKYSAGSSGNGGGDNRRLNSGSVGNISETFNVNLPAFIQNEKRSILFGGRRKIHSSPSKYPRRYSQDSDIVVQQRRMVLSQVRSSLLNENFKFHEIDLFFLQNC